MCVFFFRILPLLLRIHCNNYAFFHSENETEYFQKLIQFPSQMFSKLNVFKLPIVTLQDSGVYFINLSKRWSFSQIVTIQTHNPESQFRNIYD